MKKKLLVFASTFPRWKESMILEHDQEPQFLTWKNDTNPPFVYGAEMGEMGGLL